MCMAHMRSADDVNLLFSLTNVQQEVLPQDVYRAVFLPTVVRQNHLNKLT